MPVGDVMTRGVEFVGLDSTVQEAATLMAEHDVGAVLVGSAEALEGILTDRDILLRVIVQGADPVRTRVGEVMSSIVFSCGVDATVDEALREMQERQIRRLPVVDQQGRVLGIVVRSVLAQASSAAAEAPAAREPLTGDESASGAPAASR
jgi:CBS domain-containing protein